MSHLEGGVRAGSSPFWPLEEEYAKEAQAVAEAPEGEQAANWASAESDLEAVVAM